MLLKLDGDGNEEVWVLRMEPLGNFGFLKYEHFGALMENKIGQSKTE